MSTRTTLLAGVTAALLMLAGGAGQAVASRAIAVSPAGAIVLSPPISFTTGIFRFTCQTTFSGTFERQTRKVVGTLFGTLTGAVTTSCTAGYNATYLLSGAAPVRMTYTSFLGTLPNIRGIGVALNDFAVLITTPFATCLYRGTIGGLFASAGNPVNPNGSTVLPLMTQLTGVCTASLTISGVGPLSPTQSFTLV